MCSTDRGDRERPGIGLTASNTCPLSRQECFSCTRTTVSSHVVSQYVATRKSVCVPYTRSLRSNTTQGLPSMPCHCRCRCCCRCCTMLLLFGLSLSLSLPLLSLLLLSPLPLCSSSNIHHRIPLGPNMRPSITSLPLSLLSLSMEKAITDYAAAQPRRAVFCMQRQKHPGWLRSKERERGRVAH